MTGVLGSSLALAACGQPGAAGPIDVVIIGEPPSLFQQGIRLSAGAQHLRAAHVEGLVAFDSAGNVVPAIAERWIVTDDGLSYIFRLRDSTWPDGEPIAAEDVETALQDLIDRLEGTSLGLDLAKVVEIRAMTGRVVELRLSSPMPEFLRLLAQPELGIVKNGSGAGPMIMSRDEDQPIARLSALPPETRGQPAREDWQALARPVTVRSLPSAKAIDAFSNGEVDLILGGRLSNLPEVELGPLSRGAIQVDPALGLFGFVFRNEEGLLEDPARREALSMALDRAALIEPFALGGWQATSWIVPPALFDGRDLAASRWNELSLEERRVIAAARIRSWTALSPDNEPLVTVGLPPGPGSDLLFRGIAEAWAAIGVRARQVASGTGADLELHDRLARYASPRWFLNQLHCGLRVGLCSEEADALVSDALEAADPAAKRLLYLEAHRELIEREAFIPLGAPVRWALVRGALQAYQPNPWGLHPLFPLSQPTS
ncbi:MAG: ABC transporter substrate-binding protein [Erythrobacter sp.]|nr:ABC transporter substrate-binding protein [Erythrobacter sp.]